MSPVHLRNLGFQRNQPEDREDLSRTRRPGRGHLGHGGGWQDTDGNHTHPAIHFPIQKEPRPEDWEDMKKFLQLHQLLKYLFKCSFDNTFSNLASYGEELGASFQKIYPKEIDFSSHMVITKGWNPMWKNQQISGQEETFFTIPGSFQEKTGIQGKKQDHLKPEEERVRPNYPEAFGLGERSAQELEVVVNNSRMNSPINRNINPTQIECNVVTPESNLSSDTLCSKMSQYAEKTQKHFAKLEASNERMKELTASMDKIVKTLQKGNAQLRKASEETNKRLNLVFEEQHHIKRDRNCLDHDINKLFDFYHNVKPQPQGHVMDNPYHQDDIKPDSMLMKNEDLHHNTKMEIICLIQRRKP
ncbi:hypothetical protein O181_016252 [Austropuccinia psidii MF-1]|uniref:Uncharacterized protein n=1 Tax=Austropuccinia psidii MF-1 TaxID=1389203 RepID=A0A9Q3C586_9BASI|nr:hypothetical protein [Austropuccinia psidii MF-1]